MLRKRRAHFARDIDDAVSGFTPEERLETGACRQLGEFGCLHAGAKLEHRDARPNQLDRRDGPAADPLLVEGDDTFERMQIIVRQGQLGFGLHHIDTRKRHIKSQAADGFGDPGLDDPLLIARGVLSKLALASALPREVDAQSELGGPGAVAVIEARAQQVQVLG